MSNLRTPKLLTLILLAVVLSLPATSSASGTSGKSVSPITKATSDGQVHSPQSSKQPTQPNVAEPPAWHSFSPNYEGISMVSAINGWIVGERGTIRHYYNGGWGDYPSPITFTLRSVNATANSGWAVGDDNIILKLDGSDWHPVSSPAPSDSQLIDVKVISPTEAWAVGNANGLSTPVLLHYTSSTWSSALPPVVPITATLYQMSCGNATDCWLVGNTHTAYHYTAGTWSAVSLPITYTYSYPDSVFMLNSTEGWMGVASSGDGVGSIAVLHYIGGVWQPESPTPGLQIAAKSNRTTHPSGGCGPFYAVGKLASFSSNDYYAVGSEGCLPLDDYPIFIHNNSAALEPGTRINDLSGVAANDIWIVGDQGTIDHWNGVALSTITTPLSGTQMKMISPTNGWLIASDGQLYHYNGYSWLPSGSNHASILSFASANDGWAWAQMGLGNATFKHYNGLAWSDTQPITAAQVFAAMQMVSATDGWAVGSDLSGSHPAGLIYHYDGVAWDFNQEVGGLESSLSAVSFSGPNDGWAVGYADFGPPAGALVYHYTGSIWNSVSGIPSILNAAESVYTLAPDDIWVGGETSGNASVIIHWDGSTWTVFSVPGQGITDLAMLSPTDGWATTNTAFLHYSNGSWQPVDNPTAPSASLSFDNPTDGWAVGSGGLAHYYGPCYDYYYDIPAGYWAGDAVFYLSCHGIVSGTGNHIFSPDTNASRIQFAKMITLAQGWPLLNPPTPSFTDVPTSNPLYQFVETAHAHGAINGVDPGNCAINHATYPCFMPNSPISRAATALITQRAFGWPIDTSGGPHFSDVPTDYYAYAAIETCYHRGIVNGVGGGQFTPNVNIIRSQIARILYKALTTP